MTHIAIRCDASPRGGVGHLVRAISVADAAREAGHTVVLTGRIESALAVEMVTRAGLDVVDAPDDLGVLAAEQGASVVHVDNYDVSRDALPLVRRSGALLSSMEDGEFGRRPGDVVVDSTVRAETTDRPDDGSPVVLRGIAYAPMRAQVLAARERRAARNLPPHSPARVLIVMGGTDAMGAAATLAAVCRSAAGVGELTVIAPRQNWDAVREVAGHDVELIEPSIDFLDGAADADLVVSAAGTTSWELVCIGVPSLLVAVVENQRAGLDAAVADGVARGLGTLDEVRARPDAAASRIADAIAALHAGASWSPLGLQKVDGRGAARIVDAWESALESRIEGADASVKARPAAPDDSLMLLRWRNDPVTRTMSRSPSAVSLHGHETWFQRVLDDASRELFVVERGHVPIGTVRFDQHRTAEWEVSITIAPETRGHGLSRLVLAAGEEAFLTKHPDSRIIAAVLPDNVPSQRLFQGRGYVLDPARRDGEFDVLVRGAFR